MMLKKYKTITGSVIRGMGIGKSLGFPTINLACNKLQLPFGVYSARVYTQMGVFFGALHFGPISIFGIVKPTLEVHLIDFHGDLYNKKVKIEILKKIRDNMDFADTDALKKQIERDILDIKKLLIINY